MTWWRHQKWRHFLLYWPFLRGIHRSPVNSPHKGQWRGALMISLICAWINGWVNTCEAGDLRCHRTHYDATVMNKERKWPQLLFCGVFWSNCTSFCSHFVHYFKTLRIISFKISIEFENGIFKMIVAPPWEHGVKYAIMSPQSLVYLKW